MKNVKAALVSFGWLCLACGCATISHSAAGEREAVSGKLVVSAQEMASDRMSGLAAAGDGSIALERTNLLHDSSFEWGGYGNRSIQDGVAASWYLWGRGYGPYSPRSLPSQSDCGAGGSRCQEIQISHEGTQILSLGQAGSPVSGGLSYTFSSDVKVAPRGNVEASVGLDFYRGSQWLAGRRAPWSSPASFKRLAVTATAPPAADRATSVILLRPRRPNAPGALWAAAAELEQAASARPYAGAYRRLSGEIVSAPIDMARLGAPSALSWIASEPASTEVSFQLRSAATPAGLASAPWLGPQGADAYSNRAEEGPNLIASAGTRTTGWGVNDRRFTRSAGQKGGGYLEVRMTRYSRGDGRWELPTAAPLRPDTSYAFSVLHREGSPATPAQLFVTYEDANGTMRWGAGGSQIVSSSAGWKRDTMIFRTPAAAPVRAWVQIALDGAGWIQSRSYRVRRVVDRTDWEINSAYQKGRYLQWRALLASSDPLVTPRLYRLSLSYGLPRPEIVWPNVFASNGKTQKYRFEPGETALFEPEIRELDGIANLRDVTLSLSDPAGALRLDAHLDRTKVLGADEAIYAFRYAFPKNARLGDWTARLTVRNRWGESQSAPILLKLSEPYRRAPQRMLIGALATDYGFSHYTGAGLAKDIAAYRSYRGLDIWKVSLSWRLLEPRPGDYNQAMIAGLRAFIGAAHAAGATAQVGIEQQNFPDWVNNGSWDSASRYHLDQTRRLARTWAYLASRIKGSPGLGSYLVINEEDAVENADDYLRSVERVISAIRSADPDPAHLITIRPNTRDPYIRTRIAEDGAQDFDYGNGGYPTSPAWYLKDYVSPTSAAADLRLAAFHESPLVFGAAGGVGEVGFFRWSDEKGFGDRQKLAGFERAMTIAYEMGDDEFLMWSDAFNFADPARYFPRLVAFRDRLARSPRPARFDLRLVVDHGESLFVENRPATSGLDLAAQPFLPALRFLDERGYLWYYTSPEAMKIQPDDAAVTVRLSELKGKSAAAEVALLEARLRGVAPSGEPLPWPHG